MGGWAGWVAVGQGAGCGWQKEELQGVVQGGKQSRKGRSRQPLPWGRGTCSSDWLPPTAPLQLPCQACCTHPLLLDCAVHTCDPPHPPPRAGPRSPPPYGRCTLRSCPPGPGPGPVVAYAPAPRPQAGPRGPLGRRGAPPHGHGHGYGHSSTPRRRSGPPTRGSSGPGGSSTGSSSCGGAPGRCPGRPGPAHGGCTGGGGIGSTCPQRACPRRGGGGTGRARVIMLWSAGRSVGALVGRRAGRRPLTDWDSRGRAQGHSLASGRAQPLADLLPAVQRC